MNATQQCPDREKLLAYTAGRLAELTSEALADHIDHCPDCQAQLATLDDVGDTLATWLREAPASDPVEQEPQCLEAVAMAKALVGKAVAIDLGRLGEYQLLEKLGEGGMGAVYKALHTNLRRVVAIKVLPKDRQQNDRASARFYREMAAVGQLNHPHVVHAYDAREIEGSPVLVMEYVEGLDLSELVRRRGQLPVADACELIRQAALGLECAHEHGMVHRDIKPSNVMLTWTGQVKVLDLGLALLRMPEGQNVETTGSGQVMGTADYIAPEQALASHDVDIRADIYSLGCTLFKLLSGHAPFGGPLRDTPMKKIVAHLQEPVPAIATLRIDVPEALAGVLERMMAKEPAGRFATPAEVAAALTPFAAQSDLAALLRRVRGPDVAVRGSACEPDSAEVQVKAERRRPPTWVRVAIGLAAAAFFLGIVIWVNRTRIEVPDGSQVTIRPDGQVDVTLPKTAEKAGSQVAKQAATPSTIKRFDTNAKPITQDGVTVEGDAWRILTKEKRTVRLFEVADPGAENCMVTYRAKLRAEGLEGQAYLEMWCRMPGGGEFFSRGLDDTVKGTTGWASYETPFLLKQGERPDMIKLNVVMEGKGTLWIKDIELFKGPLPAAPSLSTVWDRLVTPFKAKEPSEPYEVLRYQVDSPSTSSEKAADMAQLAAAIVKRINPSEKAADMAQLAAAIVKRINPGATLEIDVRRAGRNTIEVVVPRSFVERAERRLASSGELEFRILANDKDHRALIEKAKADQAEAEKEHRPIPNAVRDYNDKLLGWWAPLYQGTGKFDIQRTSFISNTQGIVTRTIKQLGQEVRQVLIAGDDFNVTGDYLTQAWVGQVDGQPAVNVTLNAEGARRFGELTGRNLPDKKRDIVRRLGIIMDGQLYSAPTIQNAISNWGQITGEFTKEEAEDLVAPLNGGVLPAKIKLVEKRAFVIPPAKNALQPVKK